MQQQREQYLITRVRFDKMNLLCLKTKKIKIIFNFNLERARLDEFYDYKNAIEEASGGKVKVLTAVIRNVR